MKRLSAMNFGVFFALAGCWFGARSGAVTVSENTFVRKPGQFALSTVQSYRTSYFSNIRSRSQCFARSERNGGEAFILHENVCNVYNTRLSTLGLSESGAEVLDIYELDKYDCYADGGTYFSGTRACIRVHDDYVTYLTASADCVSKGGYLLPNRTYAGLMALESLIGLGSRWVGVLRQGEPGSYIWYTVTNVSPCTDTDLFVTSMYYTNDKMYASTSNAGGVYDSGSYSDLRPGYICQYPE